MRRTSSIARPCYDIPTGETGDSGTMKPEKKQERIVLIGLLALFCAIGAMIVFVSVFGGGLAGD